MLKRLMDYQDRIDGLLTKGLAITEAAEPDVAEMGRTRWTLARTLREYQLFKHVQLFDRWIAIGGASGDTARRMKAECIATGELFETHIARWMVSGVASDPEFAPAARKLATALRAHLVRERAGVTALLGQGVPGR